MRNRMIAMALSVCLIWGCMPAAVMAAEIPEGSVTETNSEISETGNKARAVDHSAEIADASEENQSEGNPSEAASEGDINKLAKELVEKTQEDARVYQEQKEAAEKAAEEKAKEEAKQKRAEYRKKAEEEARQAAAEARRKAEEERIAKRKEVVDFALQFEGNPYVYGGTSLTNGADCSGFVMSVFAEFGYSLPRVAADQYYASTVKDIQDIEQGDLVFYGSGGITHVALYIGDGQIIHASTSASGIKVSNYDYEQPVGVGTYL